MILYVDGPENDIKNSEDNIQDIILGLFAYPST